jgi:predicted permease
MTPEVRRSFIRLRNALRPRAAESELGRELTAHLALLEDEYVRRGLTRAAARLEARRAFGGIEQTKDLQRDARSFVWIDDARRDLRHAARLLIKHPLFALTAALSIGVGIGANTAVFTVANALLFQPPAGVAAPDRLLDIGTTRNQAGFGPSSYPNYVDLRERVTTLDDVYALPMFPQAMSLSGSGADRHGAERVFVTPVTVNYFKALSAVPALGRFFDARDSDLPGASPIAVLSYRFWATRFNADPAIVGRTFALNGRVFTIVGVAAERFHGTGVRSGDAWIPIGMGGAVATNRAGAWLLIGGRLKPGISFAQAAAEVDSIGRTLQQEYPDENRGRTLRALKLSPVPGNAGVVAAFLLLLTGIVGVVLAIACANVVGVLLARAAARRQEIAVRLAIGAGRARLIRQLLTETMVLFGLGGAIGLVVARLATSLLVARLPQLPFPIELSLAIDDRTVFFTTGLALVAALCSGLVPALQSSKTDVVSALKDDTRSPERLRWRHVFITGQIALSILLVAVAGLFVRSLQRAGSTDPGFDPHGVELASLDLSQAGYTSVTGPRFAQSLVDGARALPGVDSASLALVLPGGFETQERGVQVPGVAPPDGQPVFNVDWNAVEPGYFSTLHIPIVAGRDFAASDRPDSQDVAIVGEGISRQFWPGQDSLGQYMLQPTMGPRGPAAPARTLRIVGVVRDVRASSLIDGLAQPLVYVPLQQQFAPRLTIVARSRAGQQVADDIRAMVARLNPDLPVTAETLDEYAALGLVPQRLATSLAGGLGLVGLLLAAVGIYGVTAYMVTSRTREFGIRIALGARRTKVVRTVLGHGLTLVIAGSTIGLGLAAGAGTLLTAFLFGAPPIDLVMFSAAGAVFVLVGVAACLVPAWRASFIDPLEALRYE